MTVDTAALRAALRAAYRRASFEALDNPATPIGTLEYYAETLRHEYRNSQRAIANVESMTQRISRYSIVTH